MCFSYNVRPQNTSGEIGEMETKQELEKAQKPIEYEEVVLKLPKKVLEFLSTHEKELSYASVEKYLEESILRTVRMDVEEGGTFKFEVLATIAAVLGDEA